MALSSLKREIKKVDPLLDAIYDPNISYESGIVASRSDRRVVYNGDKSSLADRQQFPLFLYNRSSIRRLDRGPRTYYNTENVDLEHEGEFYKLNGSRGEFDLRYIYITKDLKDLEEFEISTLNRQYISSIQDVSVDLSNFGLDPFTYQVIWEENLEDLRVEVGSSVYQSISGVAKVVGVFASLSGTSEIIRSTVATLEYD